MIYQNKLNNSIYSNFSSYTFNFNLSDVYTFYFIYNIFGNINPYLDQLQNLYEKFFISNQESLNKQLIILIIIQFMVVLVVIISQYIFILIGYEKAKKKMKNLKIKIQSNNVHLTQKKVDEFMQFCDTFNIYSLYVIADFEISMKKGGNSSRKQTSYKGNLNQNYLNKDLSTRKSFNNLQFLNSRTNMSSLKDIYNYENSNYNSNLIEFKNTINSPNFHMSFIENSLINDNSINIANQNLFQNNFNNLNNSNSIKKVRTNIENNRNHINFNKNFTKNPSKLEPLDFFNLNLKRTNTNGYNSNSLDKNPNPKSIAENNNNPVNNSTQILSQVRIPNFNNIHNNNNDQEYKNLLNNITSKYNNPDFSLSNSNQHSYGKLSLLNKLSSHVAEDIENKSNLYLDLPTKEMEFRSRVNIDRMKTDFNNFNKFKRSPSHRSENLANKSNLSNKNDHSQVNLLSQDFIENSSNKIIMKMNTGESNLLNKNSYQRLLTSKNAINRSRGNFNLGVSDKTLLDSEQDNFVSIINRKKKKIDFNDQENITQDFAFDNNENKNVSLGKLDYNNTLKNLENLKSAREKHISIQTGSNINNFGENLTITNNSKSKKIIDNIHTNLEINFKNNKLDLVKQIEDGNESIDKELELKDLKDMKISEMNILKDATLVKKKNELRQKDKPKEEEVDISVEQIIYKNFLPKIFLFIFGLIFIILYSFNIFFNFTSINQITSINKYSKIIQARVGLIENLILNYEVAILLNNTQSDFTSLFRFIDENNIEINQMNKENGLKLLPLISDLENNLGDKSFCQYISGKFAENYNTSKEKEFLECNLVGNQMNSNGFYTAYSNVYNIIKILFDDMKKLKDLSEISLISKLMDINYFNVKMNIDFTFRKLDIIEKQLLNKDVENIFGNFLNIENIFSMLSLIFCIIFCISSIIIVILPIKSVEIIISWLIHKLLKDI